MVVGVPAVCYRQRFKLSVGLVVSRCIVLEVHVVACHHVCRKHLGSQCNKLSASAQLFIKPVGAEIVGLGARHTFASLAQYTFPFD